MSNIDKIGKQLNDIEDSIVYTWLGITALIVISMIFLGIRTNKLEDLLVYILLILVMK
jgi:hypothetical protein